jgi:apolipoprotein N-acyltransferase
MFGEYIPLAGALPAWIGDQFPIDGMSEGNKPVVAEVKGMRMSPSICFESTVPHLIRRQVVQLTKTGTPPDVLVNLTNDGWFHGSAILDLHFRCSIFRTIENRKPLLIAANTGISAHIDGSGRVLQRGPKREPAILVAAVHPDGRVPLYHSLGDWPAILCSVACGLLLVIGAVARVRDKKPGIERPGVHESGRNKQSV